MPMAATPDSARPQPAGGRQDIADLPRALVADLFERRPGLYWLDFGASISIAWSAVAVYYLAPPWSPAQLAGMLIAAVALFRAGTFIHEIVHFRAGEMRAFKWAWNLLFGFPVLSPWIVYRNHIEHHSRLHFGTPTDGEYLPLAAAPPLETVKYLLQIPLLPPLAVLRFGVLGPVSLAWPRLREWLLARASAAVTIPYYRRRFPAGHEAELRRSEGFCFAWLMLLVALTVRGPIEPIHWLMAWPLLSLAVGLNWLRNLAAHGYANRGERRAQIDQLDDSVNLTGQTWLAAWFFPVGLRYHALHHLLPALPYHALPAAHRRLIAQLPADHPYHRCNHRSYFSVVARLLRGAWAHRHDRSVVLRWQGRD